jgi:anti-sigma B factor antagonist
VKIAWVIVATYDHAGNVVPGLTPPTGPQEPYPSAVPSSKAQGSTAAVSKPPLTVTVKREGPVCLVSLSGELDIATAPALAGQAAVLPGGIERLIVDLSRLEFIDCRGVRVLVGLTRAAPPGCPVVVRGATGRVRRVLDILAVQLGWEGQVTLDRGEWLILESQVQRSWAQQVRADSRNLVAVSRAAREDRARPVGVPGDARFGGLRSRLTGDDSEPGS